MSLGPLRNMNIDIDEILETAASLDGDARVAFLQSLAADQRQEIESILKADQVVQGKKLLEPVSPDPRWQLDSISEMELKSLRDYQLTSRIGIGGMGEVFRATHARLQREVAVKVLPTSKLEDAEQVARFDREMQAIGQLHHPNIVQALDAGTEGQHHFLVLEFVDGLDAKQLVRTAGKLPLADACEIIRQTALGLTHAHQKRLVHRDIKPSNLLVSVDGDVKIADLGLALLPRKEQMQITCSGAFMGTPDFVAPEQIENSSTADARSDLYSLGCTFYFLLTGQAPFGSDDFSSLLNKINAHTKLHPLPVMDHRHVPDGVNRIVQQLLEKDPDQRIQSADELARRLNQHCEGARLADLVRSTKEKIPAESTQVETVIPKVLSTARANEMTPLDVASPNPATSRATLTPTATATSTRNPKSRMWRAVTTTLVCALLFAGVAANWQQIIRIATGKGVLVLENISEDFEVTLTGGDDKPVRLIDRKENREYELSIGEGYRVKVVEPKTGIQFESEKFNITRNGKTVVKVTIEPATDHNAAADRQSISSHELLRWAFDHGMDGVLLNSHGGSTVWIGSSQEIPYDLPQLSTFLDGNIGLKNDLPGEAARVARRLRTELNLGHVAVVGERPLDKELIHEFNRSTSKLLAINVPVRNVVLNELNDSAFSRLEDLALRDVSDRSDINDATIEMLATRCAQLRRLAFKATDTTSASAANLEKLKLERLSLLQPSIGLLRQLDQLKTLKMLDLTMTPQAELDYAKLPPNLQALQIEPTPPTPDQLQTLRSYKNLRTVETWHGDRYVAWKRSSETEPFSREISVGKTARQSSTATLGNDQIGFLTGHARLAVDGNTDGSWKYKSVAHTNAEKNPWWELDLGEVFDITKVEVFGIRDDQKLNRFDNINVLIRASDQSVPFGEGSFKITNKEDKRLIVRNQPSGNYLGRFVRIERTVDVGVLSLAEVRVFGQPWNPIIDPDANRTYRFLNRASNQNDQKGEREMSLGWEQGVDQWHLEKLESPNCFHFRARDSEAYLLVKDGSVCLAKLDPDNDAFVWKLTHIAETTYRIQNKLSGKCLQENPDGLPIEGELSDNRDANAGWILCPVAAKDPSQP